MEIPDRLVLLFYGVESDIFEKKVLLKTGRDHPIRFEKEKDDDDGSTKFIIECRSTSEERRAQCYYHIGILSQKYLFIKKK